jgi:glycosyltransferase involved in cell wall biosynthesis
MRVIQVAPTCFGIDGLFGGGERFPLELSRAMARGVDCELVTFGPSARVIREPGGLRIRVLRPWVQLRGHPAHPVNPGLPAALSGADLVHTHHLRSAPSRVAAVAGRMADRPLAVTDHGLGGGGWWGMLPRLFDRFLMVSRFSAATLEAPAERTAVIYGGADPARYHPPARGEERDGVLFVGRLTPHKGIDLLIRALPPDVPLTVAGTGGHDPRPPESGYPELLTRLARGRRVRFVSRADDAEIAALYRRAAVVCVPSVDVTCYGRRVEISELLGLAAIESMASGTPVIASRLGGLAEVIQDGETGFLVEPGNVAALRDRIAAVLADRRLARRLGDNARGLALERFTWQACAQRCLASYPPTEPTAAR